MASVNKAIILGNLGDDPKSVTFEDGNMATNISVATTENWKDKAGNKQERTEWHRITFYGGLAKVVDEYVKK